MNINMNSRDDPRTFGKMGDPKAHTFLVRQAGTDKWMLSVAVNCRSAILAAKLPPGSECKRAYPR